MPRPGEQELSLKGQSPTWQGLSDTSEQAPSHGTFQTLRNFYTSRDGTMLVTGLGAAKSGEPLYTDKGELGALTPTDPPGHAIMGAGANVINSSASQPHRSEEAGVNRTLVVIDDNVGAGSDITTLADFGANSAALTVDSNESFNVTGVYRVCRLPSGGTNASPYDEVHPIHNIRQVGDYVAIVVNTQTSITDGSSAQRHVGTWVSDGLLDVDSPETEWNCWFSPVNLSNTAELAGQGVGTEYTVPTDDDAYADMPARRRGVLDVTNNDLLIAVPGFGCMLKAPISAKNKERDTGLNTRLLGVPKGMATRVRGNTDASGNLTLLASYWVSLGFRDSYTGVLGLPSDPVELTLDGTKNQIIIDYIRPRDLVVEGADYTTVVYLSTANAPDSGAMFIALELASQDNTFSSGTDASATVNDATSLSRRYPRLTQYPWGAGFVKTVRGITFSGGMMASSIDNDVLDLERMQVLVDANLDADLKVKIELAATSTGFGRMLARAKIPNSWAGLEFLLTNNPQTWGSRFRLTSRYSGTADPVGFPGNNPSELCQWNFETQSPSSGTVAGYFLMPRGIISHSELGLPEVVPSTNRIIRDRIQGSDFRAAARIGQSLLLFTELETYILSWGRSPIGEDPVLISDTYGSVSANAVVEFHGTVAWLSHMGPCVLQGSQAVWKGDRIWELWSGFKRDSQGQMPHTFGVHDPERNLIIWAVRSDWDSTAELYSGAADDDVKSFFPNDELLIWNYRTDTFSTQRFSSGNWVNGMARCKHTDGLWRTAVVGDRKHFNTTNGNLTVQSFYSVYSFDDDYQDHLKEALDVAATTATQSAKFIGTTNSFSTATEGMYAVLYDSDGETLYEGTVGAVSTTTLTDDTIALTGMPATVTWASGAANLLVGVMPPATAKTHTLRYQRFARKYTVKSVTLRHELEYTGSGTARYWGKVTLTNEDGDSVSLQTDTYGRILTGSQTKFDDGYITGNDIAVQVEIVTNGTVKLKDVVLEASQG